MLAIVFAAAFALVILSTIPRPTAVVYARTIDSRDVVAVGEEGSDLPCPWCLSPTSEEDDECPGCGQRFG